jgi:hypothetical protein
MRYVRITCLPINAPTERPITLDAVLDDKDEIMGRHPLFGMWGRIDGPQGPGNFSPLVLRADGVIDYGDIFEPLADRYFLFDLRDGKIAVNRTLSFKSRDRSVVVGYLIDEICDLPPLPKA